MTQTMSQTYIGDLTKRLGEPVMLCGWLHHRREGGAIQFLVIRDGTGFAQAVVSKQTPEAFAIAKELTQETSLKVWGVPRADRRAPGGCELQVSALEVLCRVPEGEYPISPKEHGAAFLMDHRHLWIRSPRQTAVLRVRHEVFAAIRDFFHERGFIATEAPILTPMAVEGTTTLFEVKYFDESAFLSQSGQLYLEATCMALSRVYWIGPAFRAERSKTRKHLTEFWMAEAEMAYCDHEMNLTLQEALVKYVITRVLDRRAEELQTLGRDTAVLQQSLSQSFARQTYRQALDLLNTDEMQQFIRTRAQERAAAHGEEEKAEHTLQAGEDFGAPQEEALGHHFGRPVFVDRYPAKMKAFYMEPDPHDPSLALAADLIAPEGYGEIIGGSQRISSIELLRDRLVEFGLPAEPYQWYIDLRRYGSVPHAGFGLGVERTIAWLCGIDHVRETIPFPRQLYRLRP